LTRVGQQVDHPTFMAHVAFVQHDHPVSMRDLFHRVRGQTLSAL
jgi:hypothetical protein